MVEVDISAFCECYGSPENYSQTVEVNTAATDSGSTFDVAAYQEIPSLMGVQPSHGSDLDYARVNSVRPL